VPKPLPTLFLSLPLAAQTLVVDRPLDRPPVLQTVERGAKGGYADAFRIGAAGEVWMIDAVRIWAHPAASPACRRELGDEIEKITLFGALDNPPVPGVPVCDCHALVAVVEAPLVPGGHASTNPGVTLTQEEGLWRVDFRNVRWSVPGASDVLFSVRVAPRRKGSGGCPAVAGWSLAAAPAPDYRLHLLNEKGVPVGLEPQRQDARTIDIQVRATRTQPK
jgi:hypothetical protein